MVDTSEIIQWRKWTKLTRRLIKGYLSGYIALKLIVIVSQSASGANK
jgi:hypothetical protein